MNSGLPKLFEQVVSVRLDCRQPNQHMQGLGVVQPRTQSATGLLWQESGRWNTLGGGEGRASGYSYTNAFLWRYDPTAESLLLSHARHGTADPQALCEFSLPTVLHQGYCKAEQAHRCGEDTYTAQLSISRNSIVLTWDIQGPHKQQHLCAAYSRVCNPPA